MDKEVKYITISPKDFIHGPYIKCPKCGKNTFGVLMISEHCYYRRCSECLYPHPSRNEESAMYPLPELNKKVIYIDQFSISNMMKFLNPNTKAYQKGVDPFWAKLFEKLDTLCKLQLIICPDSVFHRYESLLAPFYEPLRRMYELFSHGVSFYDHETIQRFQIIRQLRIWLGDTDKIDLDVHGVTHCNINVWQGRYNISVNMKNPQELIDEIRSNREKTADYLKDVFIRWQSERDKDFYYCYNEEKKAEAKVLVKSYQKYLKNFFMVSFGLAPFNVGDLLPDMATITFHEIKERLKEKEIKEEDLDRKLGEFLRSQEFEDAPFIKISSMLYAAMARQAASGRKKLPSRGFQTDVQIISTLLPYCDAVFIDNECRGFLAERPLCDEINYGTKVFSLTNKDEFLRYLDDIKSAAPKEHLNKVEEVYGPDWGKPFWGIYKH